MSVLKILSPTCDKCGRSSSDISSFAQVYRLMELKANRPNPGNLCGACAAAQTANRMISEGTTVIEADLVKESLREGATQH
jgi:ribosomal protein L34E